MCGIAGVFGRAPSGGYERVLDSMAHRGPDRHGCHAVPEQGLALFHTLLAIQDVSEQSTQPMHSEDGRCMIVFNGEIYNFPELRVELEAKGHRFRSHTDTEVLLALYQESGVEMLRRLNGDFAFALWDGRSGELFVARDGRGVKPFYYHAGDGVFAFASEIKTLLAFPWIPRELDVQALAHYVRYLWCPAPRTPLAGVVKMLPGEAMLLRSGTIVRRWRHYDLPAPGPDPAPSTDEWVADIRHSIATAVQRQMVSDVPVGAFLSGGLDSSAVVAEARHHCAGKLACYALDIDSEQARAEGIVRDLPYAERVARHLGVDLHVVRVGPELADELPRMVWQLDEPLADPAALNVMHICAAAKRDGIKVLLSGAGGDDIFTGYRRHQAMRLAAGLDRVPSGVRAGMARMSGFLPARPPALRRLRKLLASTAHGGDGFIASQFDWMPAAAVAGLFRPELRERLGEEPLRASLAQMPEAATPLQRMLLLEQRYFLADHNLNYTDKMSMACGVETRVPLLDPDLMALAARIPDGLRQRGNCGKWIFKKAMEGILPEEVIYRSKTGFGVPLRTWLHGPLATLLNDVLSRQSIVSRGVFDPDAVQRMREEGVSGRADHGYSLLALLCIELWCRQFLDRDVSLPAAQAPWHRAA
jgi:asparagine synthase (glutamine-hydrolysing)